MILQALNDYYERKGKHQSETVDAGAVIAPPGFENKEIPFVIVLNEAGALVQIEDTRSGEGKARRSRSFLLPQGAKKSVNVAANLLWGNAEYVLGIPDQKKLLENQSKGTEARYIARLAEVHQAFIGLIRTRLTEVIDDAGVSAVLAFLGKIDLERLSKEAVWPEIEGKNPNLTFRLVGDASDMPVSARPVVVAELQRAEPAENLQAQAPGVCLVTGLPDKLERLHPAIKGVWGAQTSGGNIVSFNLAAFNSYGKEQGGNAPVGKQAASAYTAALNYLLRKGSPQRLQVGDASTVFWAADGCGFENAFAALFSGGGKDDPDRGVQAVRNLLSATQTGVYDNDDKDTRFCVLGLAPNAARISVRFWRVGPVKEFAQHIAQHFEDICIVRGNDSSEFLGLNALLANAARETRDRQKPNVVYWHGKYYDVPGGLAGDTTRAILAGLPYPAMLLQSAVRRCRAEQALRDPRTNKQLTNAPYPRAAIIKASLNRLIRAGHFQARMLIMSLDRENKDVPYLLGRLFAVFERLQLAAHKSDSGATLNRTIREGYYGSASSSPSSAFPVLVKLHQHHLSKLERGGNKGLAHYFRSLIGEIYDRLSAVKFPAHLNLPDQGLFAVGYYQQLQARKQAAGDDTNPTDTQGEN